VGLFSHRRDLRLWTAELQSGAEPVDTTMRCPPFERVAADLRRVREMLEALPPGTSYIRVNGLRRAYDELLAIACSQLGVQTTIADLPDTNRQLERIRVEHQLSESGLLLG
jgi:hypothetical protein